MAHRRATVVLPSPTVLSHDHPSRHPVHPDLRRLENTIVLRRLSLTLPASALFITMFLRRAGVYSVFYDLFRVYARHPFTIYDDFVFPAASDLPCIHLIIDTYNLNQEYFICSRHERHLEAESEKERGLTDLDGST